MNYTLLIYLDSDEFAARTDPKKKESFWGSFLPYMKALKDAGIEIGRAHV